MILPRLGDYYLPNATCSNPRCLAELPPTAEIERYETSGSLWITARCLKCDRWTPFRVGDGRAAQNNAAETHAGKKSVERVH